MSRSEKRYFVLDAKKSGRSASRYLSLFDMLSGMEELDEVKLKKKFPKNLSSDKAYLYEAILRSMRDYRSSASKAAQVKERLLDARYLHERGLYAQSNARILEAKKLATELEDNFSLLEIIREEQLSLYDRRVKVGIEQIEELQREKQQALALINEEMAYLDLYFTLLIEVFKGPAPHDEIWREGMEKRIDELWPTQKTALNAPRAQRRFFLSKALSAKLLGDMQGQYEHYRQAAEWWDKYPAMKKEEFHRYVSDVANLVNTCYNQKELFPVAQEWVDRLNNEDAPDNYHDQRFVFLTLSVSNLLHLLNQQQFQSAKERLPDIIEGMNRFGLRRSVILLANIVVTYFLSRDYEKCSEWVREFTKIAKPDTREDIQRLVRIFDIISLFELDELDELENRIRSLNRYYKKRGLAKSGFEYQVLNVYLKKIFQADLGEQKDAFVAFSEFLENTVQNSPAELPIGLAELSIWAKAHQKVGSLVY